jgi:S-adenosylmethionine:tRNA ribosyltransferase-isomerase
MLTSDFDYSLPPELIAQTPLEPRDASRLIVLQRATGEIHHSRFRCLGDFLRRGDVLVMNETRVFPARIFGKKLPGGGRIELLLLRRSSFTDWEAWVGGKGLKPGVHLELDGGAQAEIVEIMEGARRLVRFETDLLPYLEKFGHTPLPPYIHAPLNDPERYQTIIAQRSGSAAAPTAGLHFTPGLLKDLLAEGIGLARLTLHVGLDTFAPVNEASPAEHRIHSEWCELPAQAAEVINQAHASGGRVIAVGTTSVRTLETASRSAQNKEIVVPFMGNTDLFILPGYRFRAVDAMITNFHLPKSTLIMLVSAFAGREFVLNAYQVAMNEGYRFYSFGDAMLIL